MDTKFFELRVQGQLLAVAVADVLPDGLSAVYTFFDPGVPQRGLGVYALMCEIAETARRGLEYLYLGYWVAESSKMSYKTNYRPIEALRGGHWIKLALPR